MGVPIIGQKPKPLATTGDENPHRIVVIFPDNHTIDGLKVDAIGITPEQIYIAIMHLQRVALMGLARRDATALQAEAEAIAVRESLARERN